MQMGTAPVVEATVVKWIDNAPSRHAALSGPMVSEEAEELAASLARRQFQSFHRLI